MARVLIYINIIATLLILFAGFDRLFRLGILQDAGLTLVIFTAATFYLVTIFLQITMKKYDGK